MNEPETFFTGAQRNDATGRGAFELLPPRTIRLLAEHFEKGADAHGGRNWEKGIPLSRILQSAMRHTFDYLKGDQSEDHSLSALWNWAVLIETRERIKEGLLNPKLDDLSTIPSWQKPQEQVTQISHDEYELIPTQLPKKSAEPGKWNNRDEFWPDIKEEYIDVKNKSGAVYRIKTLLYNKNSSPRWWRYTLNRFKNDLNALF